jgi:hypothetical protein
MFSAFQTFGKLGAIGKAIAAAWSPLSLWPDGISSAGMWISPRDLTSEWADYTGITPVVTPGTVADSSNPVGLALDIRAGATVLTDPGNHMSQSTSAARPLLSARVNYLWQDLTGTTSGIGRYTRQSGVTVDDLGSGVYRINFSSDGQGLFGSINSNNAGLGSIVGTDYIGSIELSVESGTGAVTLREPIGSQFADTDVSLTTTWTRFDTPAAAATTTDFGLWIAKKAGSVSSCLARFPQLQMGSVATDYQRVTSTSDYDSTGFPIAQLYDGVDDGMATAAFSAGTLTSGMDCMIPVRRDSAASCVAGLYNGVADATKFFGMAESASGSGCVGSGAGTPTVWVDNTQLTGGTAVTRGTLHTALTVGSYHILEFRNLDLSTWTAAGFGLYTSYTLTGARGDILLYPSTISTEDKDAARQWLADYYGVTLP